CLQYSTKPFTF
nr:immunoglobulin light chain junction region [Macaca mulatta]